MYTNKIFKFDFIKKKAPYEKNSFPYFQFIFSYRITSLPIVARLLAHSAYVRCRFRVSYNFKSCLSKGVAIQ